MENFSIDYAFVLSQSRATTKDDLVKALLEVLPYDWRDEYVKMTPTETNILRFSDGGFEFLFDFSSELIATGEVADEDAVEDRVVATFGFSKGIVERRDASRMQGFPKSPIGSPMMDKGHLLARSSGGGVDVNLFPQRTELNRGWSERGKVFRQMEKYCAAHVGTFSFCRPIYVDRSWVPGAIEYGVLTKELKLWVERFEN